MRSKCEIIKNQYVMKEFSNLIRIFPLSSLESENLMPWSTDLNSGINIISIDKVMIEPEVEQSESGSLNAINSTLNIATPSKETCLTLNNFIKCIIILQDSDKNIYQLGEINNPIFALIRKNLNFSKLILDAKLIKNPFL